ncbi:MAG: hypothetical protein RJQ01_04550 [Microcella sp.]|uniref:hypothetical protein n=1 Tax=Microcella sp. TaxID=1913979 RepID=UPI003315C996
MSDARSTNADDGEFNPLIPEGPPPGEKEDETGPGAARVSVPGVDAPAEPAEEESEEEHPDVDRRQPDTTSH